MELLGRAVPVVQTDEGLWALLGGEVVQSVKVLRKLREKFGETYDTVRKAMAAVARSYAPQELAAAAYGLWLAIQAEWLPKADARMAAWNAEFDARHGRSRVRNKPRH